ncbi:hypothetical protein [Streptomyces sp. NPDC006285]|uniref:hypothetical protein n=1 Tax=Streptomyces sp. NPDC006285 TaxID=3364742 RepID=UPI0036B39C52
MSEDLQQKLLAAITTTTHLHGLPLDAPHIQTLASGLVSTVRAWLAERDAVIGELLPAPYALAKDAERVVNEFEGCRLSIHPDVAEDAPAALLGLELRHTRLDVVALDVPTATHLTVTVQPKTARAWGWWRTTFDTVADHVPQSCCTTLTGTYGEVSIEIRGNAVPDLISQDTAQADVLAGHPW